jgi:hypothetical protein
VTAYLPSPCSATCPGVTKSGGQYKRHHPHRNTTTSSCIAWRLAFVAALAAWRTRLLVSWLIIATSPQKRKRAPLYQNSPNSCKICLPSRKGDVGSSMEDDFIIASKTILYLFLFTTEYHCFNPCLFHQCDARQPNKWISGWNTCISIVFLNF